MMFPPNDEKKIEHAKFNVLLEQVHNQLVRNMQNVRYDGHQGTRLNIGDYERLIDSFKVLEPVFHGFKIISDNHYAWVSARFHHATLGFVCVTESQIEFYRKRNKAVSGNETLQLLTEPLIMLENEILKVKANNADKLHVIASILEINREDR